MESSSQKTNSLSLDIILPCYNPRSGWETCIQNSVKEISDLLPTAIVRIILVNDGSQYEFSEVKAEAIRNVISPVPLQWISYSENKGKGHALRKGVALSTADCTVFTDIDFPYLSESLVKIVLALQSGADIAAGIRDESYYGEVPAMRKQISRLVRRLLKWFLNLEITDTQCGLKGFNSKGRELFLRTRINRFLFDMEFIFLASNEKNIRLVPVPVFLRPGVVFTKMNWKILLGEGWNFLGIFFKFIKKKIMG